MENYISAMVIILKFKEKSFQFTFYPKAELILGKRGSTWGLRAFKSFFNLNDKQSESFYSLFLVFQNDPTVKFNFTMHTIDRLLSQLDYIYKTNVSSWNKNSSQNPENNNYNDIE